MAVKGSLISTDYKVIVVNYYYLVTVRDSEGEDFLIELFFAINKLEKFDNTPHYYRYTVSILSIYNIKCCGITVNLTGQE